MKMQDLLIPAMMATLMAGVSPVLSADDAKAGDKSNSETKKVRPHSHAEEKTGVPVRPVTEEKSATTDEKKKDHHIHPRDGK